MSSIDPNSLKELAQEIFQSALSKVRLDLAFERKVSREGAVLRFDGQTVDLADFSEIWTICIGKAGWASYDALTEMLGAEYAPRRAVVVSNVPARKGPVWLKAYRGGHPIPNRKSFTSAKAILDLLSEAKPDTLIFFFISGGGSSLVERPLEPGVNYESMKALNKLLIGCGAGIDEINILRKHLSAVKGGRLREAACDAHTVTFLLSDVPEGMPATVASGPTLPDPSTVDDCYRVAEKYNLIAKFPPSVRELFEKRRLPETPKDDAEIFKRGQSTVLLSSSDLMAAASRAAEVRGFRVAVEIECDEWPVDRATDFLFERLDDLRDRHPGEPVAVLSGGEVRVEVIGKGRGGRNQEFVLRSVEKINGQSVAVLSAGTDGIDGNSLAAGAVADGRSFERAGRHKLDIETYLRESDSFHFFEALGDAVVTGPQQNNLRDLRVLLAV